MGVNIFFVLSGFLITRILLNEKQKTFRSYILSFYYKRTLRIFPLYYAYLLGAFLLITLCTFWLPGLLKYDEWKASYQSVIHNFPYYLTYTYNLKTNLRYFLHSPGYSSSFFGHLWSLSLEEQFYVGFPFLVYFASLKTLKITTIAVIIICPVLRLWGALYGVNTVTDHYWFGELFYTNTFCQADALFTGAALAIFNLKQIKPYRTFFITASIWLLTGMLCFILLRKTGYYLIPFKSLGYDFPGFWFDEKTAFWFINIRPFYQYTTINLLAATLILPAVNGQPLFPFIFLKNWVVYLGKISYGIYIFHFPILGLCMLIANIYLGGWHNIVQTPFTQICCFILYIIIVVSVAHLSYQYFEKRILKYKYRFNHTAN